MLDDLRVVLVRLHDLLDDGFATLLQPNTVVTLRTVTVTSRDRIEAREGYSDQHTHLDHERCVLLVRHGNVVQRLNALDHQRLGVRVLRNRVHDRLPRRQSAKQTRQQAQLRPSPQWPDFDFEAESC